MTVTTEAIQAEFERAWRLDNPELPEPIWLKRTGMWGGPGYFDPLVHREWLAFQKGFACGMHTARANPA